MAKKPTKVRKDKGGKHAYPPKGSRQSRVEGTASAKRFVAAVGLPVAENQDADDPTRRALAETRLMAFKALLSSASLTFSELVDGTPTPESTLRDFILLRGKKGVADFPEVTDRLLKETGFDLSLLPTEGEGMVGDEQAIWSEPSRATPSLEERMRRMRDTPPLDWGLPPRATARAQTVKSTQPHSRRTAPTAPSGYATFWNKSGVMQHAALPRAKRSAASWEALPFALVPAGFYFLSGLARSVLDGYAKDAGAALRLCFSVTPDGGGHRVWRDS